MPRGNFLRRLQAQFGNLGLAAAAYNAGPGRVSDWMAKRGGLPGETRTYVTRITGRQAEQWTSSEFVRDPEATLMPAKAPCVEVAEAVEAQGKIVRVVEADVGACRRHQGAAARQSERRQVRRSGVADREREARVADARAECAFAAVLKNIREQKTREAQARARPTKVSAKIGARLEPDRRPDHEEGRRGIRQRFGRESQKPRRAAPRRGARDPRRGVALKRRLDLRAQFRRHLRLDAEPRLPRRDALVQQHAEPRHRAVAARARRLDQRRLARDVDDVVDQRRLRQLVEAQIERRLADHALAGGVDQHRARRRSRRGAAPTAAP